MLNYFLVVTENDEPITDVKDFIDMHDLNDVVIQALSSPDGCTIDGRYKVEMCAYEVEDAFLDLLDSLTAVPGLIWLSSIIEDEEDGLIS